MTNEEIRNRIFYGAKHPFTFNKENLNFIHTNYMLSKIQTMFEYKGLPDTMPQFNLEDILVRCGHCIVTEIDGELYALSGNGGGEPNAYYYPTHYVVANPYLNLSKTYEIGIDNVLCKNTSYFFPLLPLVSFYAHQLTENELTLNVADINTRIMTILTAPTVDIKNACEKYMSDIEDGKLSTILDDSDDEFLEGIKTHPYASSGQGNVITQILETEQYIKASFFNEIGLNANYNMKRESINGNEAGLNEDGLTPLVIDMLNCRKAFVEEINKMFGTDITVDLSPVYKKNVERASEEVITDEEVATDEEISEDVSEDVSEEVSEDVSDEEGEKDED